MAKKNLKNQNKEKKNRKSSKKSKKKSKIKITTKKNSALKKISPFSERERAKELAEKIHQKFDRLVRASILFGSQAKNSAVHNSDIDIVLIIDDASVNWDLELISWYREELGKLISSFKSKREFHINTVKLTTWFQDIIRGDPVVINILRYGEPLIDSGGLFTPLKALLLQGRLKSTSESVYAALQRAPSHLARSKAAELGSIEGVYWSMVDSAQAALMATNQLPPSPEQIPKMLHETFVSKGLLKEGSVRALRDLYIIHKAIAHGEISDIKGAEIDNWQDTAEKFLGEMTKIIDTLIETKRTQLK